MFSAFTAEETGLLGADYFANNPPVPTSNMVAFLNIDGMNVNDDVDYILQYGEGYLSIEDDLATAAALQGQTLKWTRDLKMVDNAQITSRLLSRACLQFVHELRRYDPS